MAKMNCFEKVFYLLRLIEQNKKITAKDIKEYFEETLHKYSGRQAQKDMHYLRYLADVEFPYMLEVIKDKPLTIKIKKENNVFNLFLKKYRYERLIDYLKKSNPSCQSIIYKAKDAFNEDTENIFIVSGCSIDNTSIDDDDFETIKTAIKTAHSFNRLSYRKTEAIKKMKEKMRVIDISGYCARCRKIRKMKNIEIKRLANREVLTGACVNCETEIYKGVKDGKRNI